MKRFYGSRYILVITTFLFLQVGAAEVVTKGANSGNWTMDYTAALNLAKQQQQPILLNFTGSDWCGWCKLMDRSVFSTKAWKDYAKGKLMLVTLDFPRNQRIVPAEYVQRNENLQQKFGVRGYPTYIILDHDGETVLGQLGAAKQITPEVFIKQVESILMFSQKRLFDKEQQLKGEALKAFRQSIRAYKTVMSEMDSWLATQPQRTEENLQMFQSYISKIQSLKDVIAAY